MSQLDENKGGNHRELMVCCCNKKKGKNKKFQNLDEKRNNYQFIQDKRKKNEHNAQENVVFLFISYIDINSKIKI